MSLNEHDSYYRGEVREVESVADPFVFALSWLARMDTVRAVMQAEGMALPWMLADDARDVRHAYAQLKEKPIKELLSWVSRMRRE